MLRWAPRPASAGSSERRRGLGHFQLDLRRRPDDFRGRSWFDVTAKGALDCSKPPLTIAVLSLGGPG
jgi:hypothetical protein